MIMKGFMTKPNKRSKQMSNDRAMELIRRDHGGCEDNTCTLGRAIMHGYELVAIDHWIGCGAACSEFNDVHLFEYDPAEAVMQADEMIRDLGYVECSHCDAIIWEVAKPDHCQCDNCGKISKFT